MPTLCPLARNRHRRAYEKTAKGRAARRRYLDSPKGQALRERYEASDRGQATLRRNRRAKTCRQHGWTTAMYETKMVEQAGVCAICARPPKPTRALAIDHSHLTDQRRGLLCDSCNPLLGSLERMLRDNTLAAALEYLEKYGVRHV